MSIEQHFPLKLCLPHTLAWFQIFRRVLTKMFEEDGNDCMFMEICKNLKYFPHMYIDCVPVPKETGDLAPMYFKVGVDFRAYE